MVVKISTPYISDEADDQNCNQGSYDRRARERAQCLAEYRGERSSHAQKGEGSDTGNARAALLAPKLPTSFDPDHETDSQTGAKLQCWRY